MISIMTGGKVGLATGATMFAAGNLDGGNISVTAAVSCCVFVSGLVWYVAKALQKISANQHSNSLRLKRIEKKLGIYVRDDEGEEE